MLEITIFFLLLIILSLSVVVYRLLDRVSFYEDMFESISKPFYDIGQKISRTINGTIYSNEPTIVDLVESLNDINILLKHLDEEYDIFDVVDVEEKNND